MTHLLKGAVDLSVCARVHVFSIRGVKEWLMQETQERRGPRPGGKTPLEEERQPTPVSLPGEPRGRGAAESQRDPAAERARLRPPAGRCALRASRGWAGREPAPPGAVNERRTTTQF